MAPHATGSSTSFTPESVRADALDEHVPVAGEPVPVHLAVGLEALRAGAVEAEVGGEVERHSSFASHHRQLVLVAAGQYVQLGIMPSGPVKDRIRLSSVRDAKTSLQ
jgi:hypothetical protein